jgi:hypothetical protein
MSGPGAEVSGKWLDRLLRIVKKEGVMILRIPEKDSIRC